MHNDDVDDYDDYYGVVVIIPTTSGSIHVRKYSARNTDQRSGRLQSMGEFLSPRIQSGLCYVQ